MIQEVLTHRCPQCESVEIVKNGHNPQGKQQYRCKACGRSGVLQARVRYSEADKARIVAAYYERPSMRGIERVFGVARQTLAAWLKTSGPGPGRAGLAAACPARRYLGVG
jgi:insertion element IS1 protein InsB